jgi:Muconolactone delta-isomerase
MRYLVNGSRGPGFASPAEALETLENGILPTFDALLKLEADKKIVAGGLPVGDRAFVFIAEAASHEELDQLLRRLPAWGVLTWRVTPLQSFAGRAAQEREVVKGLKKGHK